MAETRTEKVLKTFVQLLSDPSGPSGLTVHRFRTWPVTDAIFPAIAVYPMRRLSERDNFGGGVEHKMIVRVDCRNAGEPPDEALDPLLDWAVSAVMADPSLGGLALDTQETATHWDAEQADAVYGAAAVDFEVTYLTAADDPTALPGE